MPKAIDRLLTFDQAAELLGTSPTIPRRLVAERKIRFVRVGSRVRIPESAIHRLHRGRHSRAGHRLVASSAPGCLICPAARPAPSARSASCRPASGKPATADLTA